jgi:hypothetical protein
MPTFPLAATVSKVAPEEEAMVNGEIPAVAWRVRVDASDVVPTDNFRLVLSQLNRELAFKALVVPKNWMLPAVPEAVKLLLLLKVFQSVEEREPVADVPAKPKDNCWPDKDKPLAGEPNVISPVLVPLVVALPVTARVLVPKTKLPVPDRLIPLTVVKVGVAETAMVEVPLRTMLEPALKKLAGEL